MSSRHTRKISKVLTFEVNLQISRGKVEIANKLEILRQKGTPSTSNSINVDHSSKVICSDTTGSDLLEFQSDLINFKDANRNMATSNHVSKVFKQR